MKIKRMKDYSSLEEYAKEHTHILLERDAFISALKSRWVEEDKLNAQIEILKKHRNSDIHDIDDEIKKLQKKIEDIYKPPVIIYTKNYKK
jgi:hypothetical protein